MSTTMVIKMIPENRLSSELVFRHVGHSLSRTQVELLVLKCQLVSNFFKSYFFSDINPNVIYMYAKLFKNYSLNLPSVCP